MAQHLSAKHGVFFQLSLLIALFMTLNPRCVVADLRTIKLSSRPRSTLNGLRKRFVAESNRSDPLQDYFNKTDIVWFGDISLGTPPQTLTVAFLTYYPTLSVYDASCQNCPSQNPFFSNKSSTFINQNLSGGTLIEIGIVPSTKNSQDIAGISPSSIGTDMLKILDLSAPNFQFVLITGGDPTLAHDDLSEYPFSGLFGMPLTDSNQSIYSVLNANNLPSVISLFFTPKSVGNAEITLGGIDESKVNGTLTFAPVGPPLAGLGWTPWILTSSNIAVNGNTTTFLSESLQIVFDSGTSNLRFPPDTTKAIYELISPKVQPHDSLGAYGVPCSEIDSIKPSISFTFKNTSGQPFVLTVPPEEFNLGPFDDDPETCQTIISADVLQDNNSLGSSVIGNCLLKHYYSVWDADNTQMGFVIPPNQTYTAAVIVQGPNSTQIAQNHNSAQTTSSSSSLPVFFSLISVLFALLLS